MKANKLPVLVSQQETSKGTTFRMADSLGNKVGRIRYDNALRTYTAYNHMGVTLGTSFSWLSATRLLSQAMHPDNDHGA